MSVFLQSLIGVRRILDSIEVNSNVRSKTNQVFSNYSCFISVGLIVLFFSGEYWDVLYNQCDNILKYNVWSENSTKYPCDDVHLIDN